MCIKQQAKSVKQDDKPNKVIIPNGYYIYEF